MIDGMKQALPFESKQIYILQICRLVPRSRNVQAGYKYLVAIQRPDFKTQSAVWLPHYQVFKFNFNFRVNDRYLSWPYVASKVLADCYIS